MKPEDIGDQFERLTEDILEDVLRISGAEIDAIYSAARPSEDPQERVFDLTCRAAAGCADQKQLVTILEAKASVSQIPLLMKEESAEQAPRVLLLDQDSVRLLDRRKLFLERHIAVEVTTTIADAIAHLETTDFRLVIVDYCARTDQEHTSLAGLQRFNLDVPIINVGAWASLVSGHDRQLNRDLLRAAARLLRMPVPRRLPERQPPKSAQKVPDERSLFGTG
jgi:hypothetical protein